MAKTTKCMDICVEGQRFVCTFTPSEINPYRLYSYRWDQGWHRKQIVRYANFESVLSYLWDYSHTAHWGYQDVFTERSQA